jgi:hypothetical protein
VSNTQSLTYPRLKVSEVARQHSTTPADLLLLNGALKYEAVPNISLLWAAVLPAFLRGLLANGLSSSSDLTDRHARQAGEIHRRDPSRRNASRFGREAPAR